MKTARSRLARRPQPAPPPATAHARLRLAALLIVIAGVVAYANSLRGPFIFDDHRTIEDNATIQHLWPPTTVLNPRRQTPVAGRPLANLSFALNYAIGGFRVEGYHVANAAIHILAALVLFGVLRRTFAASGAKLAGAADGLALTCALAWLLHPLNTEAVDYITQRTESMAGFFYLLTLYAAIRAWDAGEPGQWRGWPVLAATANACGMATKESLVTAPIVVMLYDRIFLSTSWEAAFRRRRRLYGWLAAGWLLFAALSTQTPFFSAVGFATRVSPWTYLINQAPAIAGYLRLSFWPVGLVLDYGVPQPLSVFDVWPSAALVLALLLLTVVALIRTPKAGFWGAWFFITLAPASSVLPIPTEVAAERRMYLPLVAVVVAFVVVVWYLIDRVRSAAVRGTAEAASRPRRAWVAWLLAGTMLAALCALTIQRNAEYRSGITIWQTVLERGPHPRAHLNLAAELRDAGRLDEAVAHLRTAAPLLPDARRALAIELLATGKTEEATAELAEFVRLQPNDPEIVSTREMLGKVYFQAGDVDRAKEQFQLITKLAPQYAMGHLYLADLLMGARDFEAAAAQYRETVKVQPNNIVARTRLGRALVLSGKPGEAVQVLRDALRVSPGYHDARRALIDLLLQGGLFAEAEAESRTLVAAFGGDAEAHNGLGVALASQGRLEEAAREFSEALRLDPKSSARDNLARALARRGAAAGTAPQK